MDNTFTHKELKLIREFATVDTKYIDYDIGNTELTIEFNSLVWDSHPETQVIKSLIGKFIEIMSDIQNITNFDLFGDEDDRTLMCMIKSFDGMVRTMTGADIYEFSLIAEQFVSNGDYSINKNVQIIIDHELIPLYDRKCPSLRQIWRGEQGDITRTYTIKGRSQILFKKINM